MFVRVNPVKVFNLDEVDYVDVQSNVVSVYMNNRMLSFNAPAEVRALAWLFTEQGMAYVHQVARHVVGLHAVYEEFHAPQVAAAAVKKGKRNGDKDPS